LLKPCTSGQIHILLYLLCDLNSVKVNHAKGRTIMGINNTILWRLALLCTIFNFPPFVKFCGFVPQVVCLGPQNLKDAVISLEFNFNLRQVPERYQDSECIVMENNQAAHNH
jgi:hypothetical protein